MFIFIGIIKNQKNIYKGLRCLSLQGSFHGAGNIPLFSLKPVYWSITDIQKSCIYNLMSLEVNIHLRTHHHNPCHKHIHHLQRFLLPFMFILFSVRQEDLM